MPRARPFVILVPILLAIVPPAARAQDREQLEYDQTPLTLWLSPRIIHGLLDTVADDMAVDYNLTDEQYLRVNELLHEHAPVFIKEHQREITELASQFLEAYVSREPPDSEFVAQWAQRALPLLEDFHEAINEVSTELRPILNDQQAAKLEGYLAMVDVGAGFLDRRLSGWAEGYFDSATDWHRSPEFQTAEVQRRRELEQRMVQSRREAIARFHGVPIDAVGAPASGTAVVPPERGAEPALPAAVPGGRSNDPWSRYVASFVERYGLDDAQRQRAWLIHDQAAADRERYYRRRLSELDRIAKVYEQVRQAHDAGEVERSATLAAQARAAEEGLEAPVERMFERLKTRLDRLPSRAQRKAALRREDAPE